MGMLCYELDLVCFWFQCGWIWDWVVFVQVDWDVIVDDLFYLCEQVCLIVVIVDIDVCFGYIDVVVVGIISVVDILFCLIEYLDQIV